MFRDLKIFRRNYGKNPTQNNENFPVDPTVSSSSQLDADPSRPPFSTIQESVQNARLLLDQEAAFKRKNEKTPFKGNARGPDPLFQFGTPEKPAAGQKKFGFIPKNEQPGLTCPESSEESLHQGQFQLPPPPPPVMGSHALNFGNGNGFFAATPRTMTTGGRASSVHSGTSSTQSTPTKSISKPTLNGVSSSRTTMCGGTARAMNFLVTSKGLPMFSVPPQIYAPTEVPHFELKEDPSFWMDHNVQVVVRIRPINSMERSLHGCNRCIKQENAQTITWIGQSENRFMFDYIACETVNQEMLFRVAGLPMVENCMSGYNSCVFAYGQTGSGKTHTMLGEINDLETRPSTNRGMTPRIFEFLFARIKAEEESRRDEKVQYNCKCSFLEIYNEQITDLLNPSSTNLLIREDPRKGVHVENLKEYEVENVNDVLKLLIQGASNRKVAATNMNRESSRSHSVFTCTIESKCEKDSTITMRFARLNLVDLAGSERQKASGAEGDRLKEASNINKSLSTLGHVIMVLADLANGRQRHVPYRDSRLTFLLQDSLGGNSKTMIIANVSPSICSANETLSTLKFAQRAKVIQNNAIVNEDASGDVLVLQHQIHLLKEELSMLKRQNVSRSLSFRATTLENDENDTFSPSKMPGIPSNFNKMHGNEELFGIRVSNRMLKSFEATLAGALRREKMADASKRQLEAEIEQLNRLVRQREEDTQCSKMMIKFKEDKIYRMEALLNGLIPSESYLVEENNALSEEIKLLQSKVDRNPELTRFALENIRLLEQLRKFQDFYEEGERDILLAELSELRNQLAGIFDGNSKQELHSKSDLNVQENFLQCFCSIKEDESLRLELDRVSLELDDCRNSLKSCLEINDNLTREVNNLNIVLKKINVSTLEPHILECQEKNLCFSLPKHAEEVLNLELELDILKTIIGEEKSSRIEAEKRAHDAKSELNIATKKILQLSAVCDETVDKLKDARSVIEAFESQQIIYINELEQLRENNGQLEDDLKNQQQEISIMRKELALYIDGGTRRVINPHESLKKGYSESECSPLKEKLVRVQASLEKAWNLNMRYQTDQAYYTSNEKEMDEIRKQVEAETAEVIVCLQEELATLNQLVDENNKNKLLAEQISTNLENEMKGQGDKLYSLTLENARLSRLAEEKEQNVRSIMNDWEQLAFEIADLLESGSAHLDNASYEVASISDAFSHKNWICEQFGNIIRGISKRDSLIEELQNNLDEAYNVRQDMEWKLKSLRGATLAITESQHQESCDNENKIHHLTSLLYEKMSIISDLENKIEHTEKKVLTVEVCATIFFFTANRLFDINKVHLQTLNDANANLREYEKIIPQKDAFILANEEKRYQVLRPRLEKNYGKANSLEQQQTLGTDVHKKNEGNIIELGTSCGLVEAKMKLQEFQMQISTLKSCMHEYADKGTTLTESNFHGKHTPHSAEFDYRCQARIGSIEDTPIDKKKNAESLHHMIEDPVCKKMILSEHGQVPEDIFEKEKTIEILRKEITSALHSLKEVQSQMAEMFEKNEDFKKFVLLSQDRINDLIAEVERLRLEFHHKEQSFDFKLLQFEKKLQTIEGSAMELNCLWTKEMEELELQIKEVKDVATNKTFETSSLLNKIDEAQETMREADVMVNALMEANEIAKLDIDRLKKTEISLYQENSCLQSKLHNHQASLDEKDESLDHIQKNFNTNLMGAVYLILAVEDQFRSLKDDFVKNNLMEWRKSDVVVNTALMEANEINEVELDRLTKTEISPCHENCCFLNNLLLQASLDEKDKTLDYVKKNFKSNLIDTMDLVLTVNTQFRSLKDAFVEMFNLINRDLNELKFCVLQHREFPSMWLEEIYLDTFEKDCTSSILHLCYEGILLEKITDIDSENRFLHNGLSESNYLVTVLREQNLKAKKELQLCLDQNNNAVSIEAHLNLLIENELLKLQVKSMMVEAQLIEKSLRDELEIRSIEKLEVTERLELELLDMNTLLAQRNLLLDDSLREKNQVKNEKENLEYHVSTLNEKLQMSEAIIEENEAMAAEQLQNLFVQNVELSLRVVELSNVLHEVRGEYEAVGRNTEASNSKNTIAIEKLKKELVDASILIRQVDHLAEALQKDVSQISHEKDQFETEAYILKEELKIAKLITENYGVVTKETQRKLQMTQTLVKESEAIAAKQLEFLLMENEELKLRLMEMSKVLDEFQQKHESHGKASDYRNTMIERLQEEFIDTSILLGQRDHIINVMQKDISKIAHEKDQFESEAYNLKEKQKVEKKDAKRNEAVSTEGQRKLILENEQLKLQVEQMTRILHEDVQKEMAEIIHVKEQLESQIVTFKEQLDMAESLAEENEAVAIEARQIAEERAAYARIKDEEVKLLERSIEELECTINALQEKVRIVKEEAERQMRSSTDGWNVNDSEHAELFRHLKEKIVEVEDAQHSIQILQAEVAEKELEIVQCKSIISELNLHAEAQAREYKRKFKELEDMAYQVKSELVTSNATSLITSTKSEKGTGKSRGAGSPFKCIGLGLAQINTEKDEELTTARYKIEELEGLTARQQNEIFMLNIRLASAESMTHDVIRDLLGIKLDMTNFAVMNERSHSGNDKESEKLKKEVNEFVEERQSFLEEINQRHKELIAAQIRLEKLQGQIKFLCTENELLKADNVKYKNIAMELEEELEKRHC